MRWLIGLPLFAACGGGEVPVVIELAPETLTFGEVDFVETMPDEGYGAQYVEIRNIGEDKLNITIPGYDGDRICLEGFEDPDATITLPTLASQQLYALKIGICGYEPGELTTEVSDTLRLDSDSEQGTVELVYTYTPVTDIPIDTGR